ncbi:MAG TPA: hypothetical protein VFY10_03195 [Dehalococcoidia bacterium]|nr:hypothetical protein [Dehalococcoidia bacterium]
MVRILSLAAIVLGVVLAVVAFAPLGAILIVAGILGTLASFMDTSPESVSRQSDIDSQVDDIRTQGTYQNHV